MANGVIVVNGFKCKQFLSEGSVMPGSSVTVTAIKWVVSVFAHRMFTSSRVHGLLHQNAANRCHNEIEIPYAIRSDRDEPPSSFNARTGLFINALALCDGACSSSDNYLCV